MKSRIDQFAFLKSLKPFNLQHDHLKREILTLHRKFFVNSVIRNSQRARHTSYLCQPYAGPKNPSPSAYRRNMETKALRRKTVALHPSVKYWYGVGKTRAYSTAPFSPGTLGLGCICLGQTCELRRFMDAVPEDAMTDLDLNVVCQKFFCDCKLRLL